MKSNDTSTLRIASALSFPMTIAAATVALAGYLGLSSMHEQPRPAPRGTVVVLEDLPDDCQPSVATDHG